MIKRLRPYIREIKSPAHVWPPFVMCENIDAKKRPGIRIELLDGVIRVLRENKKRMV